MSELQKPKKIAFVDFIPAELREGKTWLIVYYALNPYTHELERKRKRVKPVKSITERRKLGKRMVATINRKLESGWNPFLENPKTKEFTRLFDVFNTYLNQITIEYKGGNLSWDTLRTYTSRIKNIKEYLESEDMQDLVCNNFNVDIISDYLDYLRYDLGREARTRDNYMTFINTFCGWMVSKRYVAVNYCESFKKINRKQKTRIVIPPSERNRIFQYYKQKNFNYLILCMTCYYCLVRRTELSKIKVGDLSIKNKTLYIEAADSKNNKSAHVTVPDELLKLLVTHVKTAKSTDFLFSDKDYLPGSIKFKPNKCTSNWSRMRKKLGIDSNIKWYSLKDTGITDLIVAGVPLISVRDQARHESIKQTDEYTPRSMKRADANISNSGVNFLKK